MVMHLASVQSEQKSLLVGLRHLSRPPTPVDPASLETLMKILAERPELWLVAMVGVWRPEDLNFPYQQQHQRHRV